jgi:hypothetical protein
MELPVTVPRTSPERELAAKVHRPLHALRAAMTEGTTDAA